MSIFKCGGFYGRHAFLFADPAKSNLLVPCVTVFISSFCIMAIELIAGRGFLISDTQYKGTSLQFSIDDLQYLLCTALLIDKDSSLCDP